MSTTATSTSQPNSIARFTQVATWPPLVYIILGVVCLGVWAAGTAIQVQTSEAWMMGTVVNRIPTLATFAQVGLFISGGLPESLVVPFAFAWSAQIALIAASVGIELPKEPKWRYYTSWAVVILLIGTNSAGDWSYSAQYGTWGQIGFTMAILFLTFFVGLLAVMCFVHAFRKFAK